MPGNMTTYGVKVNNQSFHVEHNQWCYSAAMQYTGENIRKAREAHGLSQAALGEAVGVSQATIEKIEKGQTKKSKYLADIAAFLKLDQSDSSSRNGARNQNSNLEANALRGERNFPVFGAAEGGDGTVAISNEPVDYVRRPAPLENVRDGYGVIVAGESMVPEYRPGDTALVHPYLPPAPGKVCIFYSDDGHGEVKVTIKTFLKATSEAWHVEQHNPPKKFTLPRKEWTKCHSLVGRYDRR